MQNKFAWITTPDVEWEDKKEMITTALESGIDHVLDLYDMENIKKLGNVKIISNDDSADIYLVGINGEGDGFVELNDDFVDSIDIGNIHDVDSIINRFTEYYGNMSELYKYDFEQWNAKKAVVVSNNLYDIWTLIDQYCQIKGYKIADGQNIMSDLLKMTIYDLILNQGDRHISNWSIILDKTTNEIRFAPIYDNSNICNLNQDKSKIADKAHAFEKFDKEKSRMNEVKLARVLEGLSKQLNANDSKIMVEFEDNKVKKNKLDMIEKLLKTSDVDTIRMIREICGQFTAENVDTLLDNFVSEYGVELPSEVKTMVRKTIEFNMKDINELLAKYDSSSSSTTTLTKPSSVCNCSAVTAAASRTSASSFMRISPRSRFFSKVTTLLKDS